MFERILNRIVCERIRNYDCRHLLKLRLNRCERLHYASRRNLRPREKLAWQPRPILVLKDALTAIGVAVLVIGAYRLMAALGELIAFSGAMGQ